VCAGDPDEQSGDEDYCLYDDSLAKPTAIPPCPWTAARDSYPSHHHHLDLQPTEKTYVTHSEEIGEPEEEVMTFTDEHGSRITKKVVRRRQVRKVITNKVVESPRDPRTALLRHSQRRRRCGRRRRRRSALGEND
ncbi:hypothetical protein BOX15_Mlig009396g1, partial [Macrostomum lignano]